jgi:crotonobetainyl-CoA:carnitine CoA-transferase CaiB-like acyl-CoA transferase
MPAPLAAPLAGVRVIECSLLEPGSVAMHLAAFGAEVIKVEAPGSGDYARELSWPIVDGVSLLHWHINQGKRSIVLDLRTAEGADVFLDLVKNAHVVVEGMRPGALAKRGLGYDRLKTVNPKIVFCTLSGYGATGPYKDMPSHGIGFDAWAGCAKPVTDANGFAQIPATPSVGTRTGPVWAALAVLAALRRADHEGVGAHIDVAQSDCAAFTNWIIPESYRAYERPESEVTGNRADGYKRRAPGTEGTTEGVRYQYYRTRDGHVLFMASEREFWENFCRGVGRPELFENKPGEKYADHAIGDHALRRELQAIFDTRTTAEWIEFGLKVNTPIMVVHDGKSLLRDPQFQHRFPWLPANEHGSDLMPVPVKFTGEELPRPLKAPRLGEHTDGILSEVLRYDAARIAALKKAKATV